MRITYEVATPEHARLMAPRLRPDDRAELLACGFETALDGLLESIALSEAAYTVMLDGEPASMMGVVVPEIIGQSAMPWALTTDLINAYPLAHTRDARRILEILLDDFERLENYVDARYDKAVRWLKLLGFTVHEPEPIGPHGAAFRRFEISRVH